MLSSHSGVSERPNPGCSGTITSKCSDSVLKKGSQTPAPRPPCRNKSGLPRPPRSRWTLHPATVSKLAIGSLIGPTLPPCTFDGSFRLGEPFVCAARRIGRQSPRQSAIALALGHLPAL